MRNVFTKVPGNLRLIAFSSVVLTVLFTAWTTLAEVANPGESDLLSRQEREWLADHPTITLAPDPDYIPIEYFDEQGRYNGIAADYVALIEKKLGIRLKIVRLRNWDEVLAKAQTGEIDVLGAAAETPQRLKYLSFTSPFIDLPDAIIVRKSVTEFLTLDRLAGMKVAIVSGYADHDYVLNYYPQLRLDVVPTVEMGLRKVSFGMVDAFVTNLAAATYYIESGGITNLRLASNTGYTFKLALAVRKDWPELAGILQKGLNEISPSEREAIARKWIHLEQERLPGGRALWGSILGVFGAASLALVGMLLWNRSLRSLVDRRTEQLSKELGVRMLAEKQLQETQSELERRVEARTSELKDANERLQGEIEGRLRIETALRESEERYRQIFETSPAVKLLIDPESGRIVNANEAAGRFYGYTREEMSKKRIFDLNTATEEKVRQRLAEVVAGGRRFVELQHRLSSGDVRDVEVYTGPLTIGHRVMVHSIIQDVTDRKTAEKALFESEERFRVAAECASDLIYEWDIRSEHLEWFGDVDKHLGYAPGEFPRTIKAWEEAIHPEDHDRIGALIERHLKTREPFNVEYRILRRNGEVLFWTNRGKAFWDERESPYRLIGAVTDITDRKGAEEDLRQTRDYLEYVLEHSPDAIGILDVHGRFVKWNRVATELFGYTYDEIRGRSFRELYAEMNEVGPILGQLRSDGSVKHFEANLKKKPPEGREEGELVPVELSIGLFRDSRGIPLGSICVARDLSESRRVLAALKEANEQLHREIGERRKVEEALKQSENIYRAIFENTGTAMLICEEDTTICLANARFEALSGYSCEEIEGKKNWTDFVSVTDLEMMKGYHQGRRSGRAVPGDQYEFHFVDRWKRTRDVLANVQLVPETSRSVASLMDITDRKKMEDELVKSRQLESIGILAGGIAHDFNNLLGVILGNISLTDMSLNSVDDARVFLKEATNATLRARDLAQQLLTFAKGGEPKRKIESIRAMVMDSVKLGLAGSKVEVHCNFPEDLWPVECDSGQIQRAFMNLILNAKDSMPQGGTVEATAVNKGIGEDEIPSLEPGQYVCVSIRDCGSGISPDNIARIFDPYFSTKTRGSEKGMGLGLTIAYSIIRKHGGHVTVESLAGVGTTFHVYLPARPYVRGETEVSASGEPANARKKILFMDDEEMYRLVGRQMLIRLGFDVETAADGVEAVQCFRKAWDTGRPFDAVILDLTVRGGMGGEEVLKELREMDESTKAIVSSGYSNDPILSAYSEYGFCAALPKPYEMEELKEVLEKVMG